MHLGSINGGKCKGFLRALNTSMLHFSVILVCAEKKLLPEHSPGRSVYPYISVILIEQMSITTILDLFHLKVFISPSETRVESMWSKNLTGPETMSEYPSP